MNLVYLIYNLTKKPSKKLIISMMCTVSIMILIVTTTVFFSLKPQIHLNGDKTIYVQLNELYEEPGYTAQFFNQDLTDKVISTNNIDVSKLGEYEINYKIKNYFKTSYINRKIVVVDSEKPNIILSGTNEVTIYINEEYEEPGYMAFDNYDGDITEKVVINNEIDNTKIGEYTVYYTVSDSSNNTVIIPRIVKVIEKPVNQAIVNLAVAQLGNRGGEYFWRWFGYDYRVEWCAVFISWLADQFGYLYKEVPKTASVLTMVEWFKSNNKFKSSNYEPQTGQIVFIDWDVNGRADHVGIVEKVENGILYTVEGNSKDEVRRKSYPITSKYIYGYGTPLY